MGCQVFIFPLKECCGCVLICVSEQQDYHWGKADGATQKRSNILSSDMPCWVYGMYSLALFESHWKHKTVISPCEANKMMKGKKEPPPMGYKKKFPLTLIWASDGTSTVPAGSYVAAVSLVFFQSDRIKVAHCKTSSQQGLFRWFVFKEEREDKPIRAQRASEPLFIFIPNEGVGSLSLVFLTSQINKDSTGSVAGK